MRSRSKRHDPNMVVELISSSSEGESSSDGSLEAPKRQSKNTKSFIKTSNKKKTDADVWGMKKRSDGYRQKQNPLIESDEEENAESGASESK